ncbi:hypothetical protein JCM11251_004850 [Rhodosporidiobolus azoricus]
MATPAPATPITQKTFPSLVHLVFWMDSYDETGEASNPKLAVEDVDHLETVIISQPLSNKPYHLLRPQVLVDLPFEGLSAGEMLIAIQNGAQYLRFYASSDELSKDGPSQVIDAICATLEENRLQSRNLELLYLPSAFRPSSGHTEELASSIDALLGHCARQGIEVGFEDTDELANGALASPAFRQYLKGKREHQG